MLRSASSMWSMITAEQLRDARIRAGFTSQQALAEALGVSVRTVTAWEQEGAHVSARAEARVRALLWPSPEPLSHYTNYELLSEIGRRLEAASRDRDDPPLSVSAIYTEGDTNAGTKPGVSSSRRRHPAQGRAGIPQPRRHSNEAHTEDDGV